jgi:hypothetical protein
MGVGEQSERHPSRITAVLRRGRGIAEKHLDKNGTLIAHRWNNCEMYSQEEHVGKKPTSHTGCSTTAEHRNTPLRAAKGNLFSIS